MFDSEQQSARHVLPVNPNDCSMDFVLGGIAHGLGYATLTIYMT